ncbi:hypothetical protein [Methylobacter sp. YRD-M1]|uniref:hypothetical protein n=1 Tax=Methylobacter sp. YRD-M1 TaxID=2911520 RepID=UPI00227D5A41|nr:hypothetical protein [Methylobacter sp. YRD-M1]WAK00956.1 hypothetical protein LZ558_14050 [Methylobacter sp. YRD-M1]
MNIKNSLIILFSFLIPGYVFAATTVAPHSSFDGSTLKLPIVNVSSQKFNATLGLTLLNNSPTGYGFVLKTAELTTASSNNPATFTPETGQVLIPSIEVTQDGTSLGTGDAQLTLIAGSDPMQFILEEPGFPNLSTAASYSYDTTTLTLPVVFIGTQRFRAGLKLIPLQDSPTGLGFVLETAELTATNSDIAVNADAESGLVTLPYVEMIKDGVSQTPVSAEMELVTGSNPLLFRLLKYPPIQQ